MAQRTELSEMELEKVRSDFKKAIEKDPKLLTGSLFNKETKSEMAALILSMYGHIDYLEVKLSRNDGSKVWNEPTGESVKKAAAARTAEEEQADFDAWMLTQKTQASEQTPEWIEVRRKEKAKEKLEQQEWRKSRKLVCPTMKAGR
jgi:hypothetical protein